MKKQRVFPISTTHSRAENCPVCGTSLSAILQSGRCGCPNCYRAFEEYLRPLLLKKTYGKHKGRVPQSVQQEEYQKRVRVFEAQIQAALSAGNTAKAERLAADLRALQGEL